MRSRHPVLATLLVAILAACNGDASGNPQSVTNPPLGYVRYFNAVSDTLATDFRPIDQVTYSTPFLATPYRGLGLGNYQGYATGSRKIRVFPTSTDINVTSKTLVDTTVTVDAGKYYSVIHYGYARAGSSPKQALWVLEDVFPSTPSGIAIRFIHTGIDLGAVDVYVTPSATDPLGTPVATNLAPKGVVSWVQRATGAAVVRVFAAGTTATPLITATMQAGTAGTTTADPIGGSTVSGTIATAMIYSKSIGVAQASASPTMVFWIDRQPPRTTSP